MTGYDNNLFYDFQLSRDDLTWKIYDNGGCNGNEILRGIADSTLVAVGINHNYSGLNGFMGNLGKGIDDVLTTVNQAGTDFGIGDKLAGTVLKGIGDFTQGSSTDSMNSSRHDYVRALRDFQREVGSRLMNNKMLNDYINKPRMGIGSQLDDIARRAGKDPNSTALKRARAAIDSYTSAYNNKKSISDATKGTLSGTDMFSKYMGSNIKNLLQQSEFGSDMVTKAQDMLKKIEGTDLGNKILQAGAAVKDGGQIITGFDSIKVFRGTKIDYSIPTIQTRLIYGVGPAANGLISALTNIIKAFSGNFGNLDPVDTQDNGQVLGVQRPPNNYTPIYGALGDSDKNPHCYSMKYGSHKYYNLIVTGLAITLSTIKVRKSRGPYDNYKIESHEPLYADISIQFDKAQYPVTQDLINFISST